MAAWFISWLTLAGLTGLLWLIRWMSVGRILRKRYVLSSRSYPGPPLDADSPDHAVSVIVAAKDEEENIETCVRGLLDQDYPNYELIVVDDRSRDRTPAILQRLEPEAAARNVPFRVITIHELREGWFGKNNAMREGVAAARGPWLLFTDADCRQTSRRTISMAMREAIAAEADFLSVTPVLESRTTWERIIQPVCSLALMVWFLPHRVNKPGHKAAYANGAFMLMRRTGYDAIGGHERVRTEVNEDIHMARLAKHMGLRLRVVENDDLYCTRMYGSLAKAWRGWSRIFYGCLSSLSRLSVAALVIVVLGIVPWVSLMLAAVGLLHAPAATATPWMLATGAWLVVVVLEQIVMWRAYAILRANPLWSLTYLLGALVTAGMIVNAMFKVVGAGSTTWRGTIYRRHHRDDRASSEPARGVDGAHAPSRGSKAVDDPVTHA